MTFEEDYPELEGKACWDEDGQLYEECECGAGPDIVVERAYTESCVREHCLSKQRVREAHSPEDIDCEAWRKDLHDMRKFQQKYIDVDHEFRAYKKRVREAIERTKELIEKNVRNEHGQAHYAQMGLDMLKKELGL